MPLEQSWSPRARAVTVGVIFASGSIASGARAQQGQGTAAPALANEEHRTALYREGVEAATAGRWADARERFAAALAMRSSPKVLFSLAQSEEHLGRVASALEDYGRALDGARASGEADVVTAAEAARGSLAPRVPHLRVVVSGASRGRATATLDERPVEIEVPAVVDPGAHTVVVTAPGARTAQITVTAVERQAVDVAVALVDERAERTPAGSAAQVERPRSGAGPWPLVGLITAGAGVASLGVGAYLGLDALSKNGDSNRDGCSGNDCTPAGAQERRAALSSADASTAAFVVGGVLAAGGLALWVISRRRVEGGATLAPVALSGGGGLLLQGGWP